MRAIVLGDDGPRFVEDHPEPTPGEGEALVHLVQAGICDTDLELSKGYAGFRGVLGHEFIGQVDAADPVLGGRRVVAAINIGCGDCPRCDAGDPGHCARRQSLGIRDRDGVFAERVAIPRARLVPLPVGLPDDLAVFAEPLAAALHVLDEFDPAQHDPNTPVAVLGDGKLGLLIAMSLAAAGLKVRSVGHHRSKLALAAAAGVETVLESELDSGWTRAHDLVVEATGHPSGLARALSLCAPRGTVVLKSTTHAPITLDLAAVVVHELRVVGSRCGDMQRAVDLLAEGTLDLRPLIAARYPLEAGLEALARAASRGTLKVLLTGPPRP